MSKANPRHGEIDQGVLYVSASDPDALRAVLEKHLDESTLRVVVVALAGGSRERQSDTPLRTLISDFRVPIIVCANGLIRGWAMDVLLGAHLCFAAESGRFDLTGSADLKEQIGSKGNAGSQIVVSAREMLKFSEINGVFPTEDLMVHTERTALRIAKMAPLAVSACLKAVAEAKKSSLADGLAKEASLFAELFDSQDMRRGTTAFLEKSKPVFEGN